MFLGQPASTSDNGAMEATILHADLDAFYASVEQLLDPSLHGKPIAVGGGVVLAASYEAKAFGVRGGMPGRRARELCPELIFVGGHFSDYQRLGDAAMRVLGDFTPLVERISIDEAFADVAGTAHLFGPPAAIAATIRRRVRSELGLPISVGVARTKHLAKIASQVAKPDGLVVVDPASELKFLHALPVELMWGVGPATTGAPRRDRRRHHRAARRGLAARARPAARPRGLGEVFRARLESRSARRAHAPARALRRRAVGARPQARSRARIVPALRHLADRIGSRLRAKSRFGRTVTVRVRFADLRAVTRSLTLPAPVAATAILAEVAEDLVRGVLADHPAETAISLLAISVSNLEEQAALQLELPLALRDEARRPGSRKGAARWLRRPRARQGARPLRLGGGRLRVGRARRVALGAGRVSRARREGVVRAARRRCPSPLPLPARAGRGSERAVPVASVTIFGYKLLAVGPGTGLRHGRVGRQAIRETLHPGAAAHRRRSRSSSGPSRAIRR